MTEHTTIRVSKDAKAKADEAKKDNETWNEFIQRLSEEPPEIIEFAESPEIDYTELANQTAEEVERRLR